MKTLQLQRKEFYFIRHGETELNANPYLKCASSDLPLNERGRLQASKARAHIARVKFQTVCFSPLLRAVETKNLLTTGCLVDHVEIDDLRECETAVWRKLVRLRRYPNELPSEEVNRFLVQAVGGIDRALKEEGPILVVAHGGIHWALCSHLKIKDHPWKIKNCELVHFHLNGNNNWAANILNK